MIRNILNMCNRRNIELKRRVINRPKYYYNKKNLTIESLSRYYIKVVSEEIENLYGSDAMEWMCEPRTINGENRFVDLEDCFKNIKRMKDSPIFKNEEHSISFDVAYLEVLTICYEKFIYDICDELWRNDRENKCQIRYHSKLECLNDVELMGETVTFSDNDHEEAFIAAHSIVFYKIKGEK